MVVIIRMWVICLLRIRKQLQKFPLTVSENSADSNLAEVAKSCWMEEYPKVPVVARIAKRLKMQSNCDFAKFSMLKE